MVGIFLNASMVELVDTYGLGPYAQKRESSSLSTRTLFLNLIVMKNRLIFALLFSTLLPLINDNMYNYSVDSLEFWTYYGILFVISLVSLLSIIIASYEKK